MYSYNDPISYTRCQWTPYNFSVFTVLFTFLNPLQFDVSLQFQAFVTNIKEQVGVWKVV